MHQNSYKIKAVGFQLQHFNVMGFFSLIVTSKMENKQLHLEVAVTKLIEIKLQERINTSSFPVFKTDSEQHSALYCYRQTSHFLCDFLTTTE